MSPHRTVRVLRYATRKARSGLHGVVEGTAEINHRHRDSSGKESVQTEGCGCCHHTPSATGAGSCEKQMTGAGDTTTIPLSMASRALPSLHRLHAAAP